jgi:hypothetical protein
MPGRSGGRGRGGGESDADAARAEADSEVMRGRGCGGSRGGGWWYRHRWTMVHREPLATCGHLARGEGPGIRLMQPPVTRSYRADSAARAGPDPPPPRAADDYSSRTRA